MRRSTKFGAVALLTVSLSIFGCGEEGDWTQPDDQDLGDTSGIPELEMALTPLATPCTYDDATKTATVVLATEFAVIAKRSVDSALVVNGIACSTALASTVKRINVTGGTGIDTLVLDYMNGIFAAGSSGSVGVSVDLGITASNNLRIRGSKSADTISFGVDGISVNTGTSLDISYTNVADFVVSSGAGNDKVYGTGGNGSGATSFTSTMTIYGGEGNDTLTGGSGDDTINGGDGNDIITGSAGDDTLNGDDGDDTFNEEAADSGSEVFTGGLGTDTVDYSARTAALTITMDAGATDDGEAGEADDVVTVEVVKGGTAADTITGGANADTIYGGPGDDIIDGGAGDDVLYGEAGDDTFNEGTATSGADIFNGGTGTDTVSYTSRTAALVVTINTTANDGESGEGDNVKTDVENLVGGSANDTFTGSSSANSLDGGAGDDVLNGGSGDDTFPCGAADDGSDTFNGGTGTDTVDYSARVATLTITMGDATGNDGLAGEADNVADDVENLLGSLLNINNVTGNDLDNLIEGGALVDTFNGGLGNDVLYGLAGDDVLNGDAGDDTIDGGAGTDVVDCGAGDGDISFEGGTNCEL
ncbi:MAG: calcium-binding protein [Deltaproteobacteria bacterium]|nr:calcium-binding protein [Deltaproteobacteria bacterium]